MTTFTDDRGKGICAPDAHDLVLTERAANYEYHQCRNCGAIQVTEFLKEDA